MFRSSESSMPIIYINYGGIIIMEKGFVWDYLVLQNKLVSMKNIKAISRRLQCETIVKFNIDSDSSHDWMYFK